MTVSASLIASDDANGGDAEEAELDDNITPMRDGGTLFNRLEGFKRDNELKQLHTAFDNLDEMFGQITILVEDLNASEADHNAYETTLQYFLTAPHKKAEIVAKINQLRRKELPAEAQDYIVQSEDLSFVSAINLLWEKKVLTIGDARQLILRNAPMTPAETIRLIENGIAKTEDGLLIKMRTGENYGDALGLTGRVDIVINRIKREHPDLYNGESITELLTSDLREEVIEALDELGFSGDKTICDFMVLSETRRHLMFLSTVGLITWFSPGGGGSGVFVDRENSFNAAITPRTLSAVIAGNHYISGIDASMSHSLYANPMGITYSGSLSFDDKGADWWISYSDGYLGGGGSYTVNFDEGAMWSNGEASYLSFGGFLSGWSDRLSAGISLQTMLANGVGVGVNASVSVSQSHDVTYLGEYPIDGKFAEIRGLRKIEINDKSATSVRVGVSLAASQAAVPVSVAFKATKSNTHRRLYRTHTNLIDAQKLMKAAKVPGILLLAGKRIKETRNANFERPEDLQVGDELVEVKTGTLMGAFVLGIESIIPLHAARLGGSVEIGAEFELGLRRLPNNKYEVSIEPKNVKEMSIFGSVMNVFGAGKVKGMALARKQIFMFDFNKSEAKRAYFDLVHHGRMPTNGEIEVYTEDRGPEHLLTEFRAQNVELRKKGIERTFLEKVQVDTSKKYFGFKAPIVNAFMGIANKIERKKRKDKEALNFSFEGIDREFLKADTKSLSTNGIVAVRTHTYGGRKSEGQGTSGRYNEDLFVSHRRLHTNDEKPNGNSDNRWQFDSLVLHAQLQDTIITEDEENKLAEKISKMFGTYFGDFVMEDSKTPRLVNLERHLNREHLARLASLDTLDNIGNAVNASEIDRNEIRDFIDSLKNKHPDKQAILVKEFVERTKDLRGFAAIHQLLGGKAEDLLIHTEAGYMAAVRQAESFIVEFSLAESQCKDYLINILPNDKRPKEKHVQEFFDRAKLNLKVIGKQLRLLNDDRYLLDDRSHLNSVLGENEVHQLIAAGVRQDKTTYRSALVSARHSILEMLDLKGQGFSYFDRSRIYNLAGKKRLTLFEKADILQDRFMKYPISPALGKKKIVKQLSAVWDLIDDIDKQLGRLKKDEVMQKMDPGFVKRRAKALNSLREDLAKLVDLGTLDANHRQRISEMLENDDNSLKQKILSYYGQKSRIQGTLLASDASAKTGETCPGKDEASVDRDDKNDADKNDSENSVIAPENDLFKTARDDTRKAKKKKKLWRKLHHHHNETLEEEYF